MSNEITVDKEFFEHLLNCMAKQKNNHPNSQGIYVGVNEPRQEAIDTAYHKARALLSQDSKDNAQETFRRFNLVRTTDITGISGTGEIAVGVQWPDQTCHLFWLKTETSGSYKSIDQLQQIHCYNDASGQPNARVEWMD